MSEKKRGRPKLDSLLEARRKLRILEVYERVRKDGMKYAVAIEETRKELANGNPPCAVSDTGIRQTLAELQPQNKWMVLRCCAINPERTPVVTPNGGVLTFTRGVSVGPRPEFARSNAVKGKEASNDHRMSNIDLTNRNDNLDEVS
jgi:hypothetical protein